jgi:hypothetical protein
VQLGEARAISCLEKKAVQTDPKITVKTERKQTMVADYAGLLLGIMNHHSEEKIVVTLSDGSERHFDYLTEDVMKFWTDRFAEKDL